MSKDMNTATHQKVDIAVSIQVQELPTLRPLHIDRVWSKKFTVASHASWQSPTRPVKHRLGNWRPGFIGILKNIHSVQDSLFA
jgi:hypothetical protein